MAVRHPLDVKALRNVLIPTSDGDSVHELTLLVTRKSRYSRKSLIKRHRDDWWNKMT